MAVKKHGREKVKIEGYTKHKWRCPKCGRAAPDDFCIVHGDVTAVDITKNAKIRKMALEYSAKTEKIAKQKTKSTSLRKEALAYLKKCGYTGIISGEFLAKKEKLGVTLSELKKSHLDLLIQADKEAKTKEKERKRKDSIGKQGKVIVKTKKKTKKVGTTQVEKRQSQRTKRARSMDSKKQAKRVVKADRYHLWLKHPERYDIEGIDT